MTLFTLTYGLETMQTNWGQRVMKGVILGRNLKEKISYYDYNQSQKLQIVISKTIKKNTKNIRFLFIQNCFLYYINKKINI